MDLMRRGLTALALASVLIATSVAQDGQPLLPAAQRVGQGDFKRLGWSIYQASLWAPEGQYTPGQPFALSLTYAFDISRSRIVDASLDEMARLGAPVNARQEWRGDLERVLRDVSKGHTLTAVYQPGEGASFFYNNMPTGQLNDALSRQFFAIWLDPRTSEPDLRAALLGQAK